MTRQDRVAAERVESKDDIGNSRSYVTADNSDKLRQQKDNEVSPLRRCMTDEEAEILRKNSVSDLEREFLDYIEMQQTLPRLHHTKPATGSSSSHRNSQDITNSYSTTESRHQHQNQHVNQQQQHHNQQAHRQNSNSNLESRQYQDLNNAAPSFTNPAELASYMSGQNPMMHHSQQQEQQHKQQSQQQQTRPNDHQHQHLQRHGSYEHISLPMIKKEPGTDIESRNGMSTCIFVVHCIFFGRCDLHETTEKAFKEFISYIYIIA